MGKHTWVNLFSVGQIEGFVYFKAYLDQQTNRVVGWVTRSGLLEPYAYTIYYVDTAGKIVSDTRGTWQHADWAVQGAIASLATKLGVLRPRFHAGYCMRSHI